MEETAVVLRPTIIRPSAPNMFYSYSYKSLWGTKKDANRAFWENIESGIYFKIWNEYIILQRLIYIIEKKTYIVGSIYKT